jgi:murein DD-endopeptidase MepM/ murein hydrolase activator NlpD
MESGFMHRFALIPVLLMIPASAGMAGALILDGPMVQGGLVQGRTDAGTRIEFDGRAVRVSTEGVFLIGFGRDAPAEMRLRATFPDGSREWRVLKIAQRKYRIQRVNGLPPRKVTPRAEDLARIRADVALIKKARARDDARADFLTGFKWPASGRITGVYGSQRFLNGKPGRPHYGLDIDGVVTLAHPNMFYSGVTLIVDHGHGLSSAFLHLNRILVKEGMRVRQGEPIAEVGATGRVNGAHLDWRINLFGRRLDPQLVLEAMAAGENSDKIQATRYK